MGIKNLFISGDLNDAALADFVEAFRKADERKGLITVTIHSRGGDVDAGTSIYEMIRTSKNPVAVVGMGEVASMAVLVLMAGDHRMMTPGSVMLLHDGSVSVSDSLMKAKAVMAQNLKSHRWYSEQIANRSGMSLESALTLTEHETYLTPKEALAMGLIDEIKLYRPFTKQLESRGRK